MKKKMMITIATISFVSIVSFISFSNFKEKKEDPIIIEETEVVIENDAFIEEGNNQKLRILSNEERTDEGSVYSESEIEIENESIVEETVSENKVAKVETSNLNVRTEPSTDAEIVSTLPKGDVLTIVEEEEDEGFVKVTNEEVEGYVSSDYVGVYLESEIDAIIEQELNDLVVLGEAIVDYATQYVGNPYVWGGTSLTKGADCSGFVLKVFENFDIELPRTSGEQGRIGEKVASLEEALPGDIIWYSGHIAIYMGDGQIVHASNRREGIKVSDAEYRTILGIRRLL